MGHLQGRERDWRSGGSWRRHHHRLPPREFSRLSRQAPLCRSLNGGGSSAKFDSNPISSPWNSESQERENTKGNGAVSPPRARNAPDGSQDVGLAHFESVGAPVSLLSSSPPMEKVLLTFKTSSIHFSSSFLALLRVAKVQRRSGVHQAQGEEFSRDLPHVHRAPLVSSLATVVDRLCRDQETQLGTSESHESIQTKKSVDRSLASMGREKNEAVKEVATYQSEERQRCPHQGSNDRR